MPDAPFDRVDNGYDPKQVAAFAAKALAWKRELAEARSTLTRYERIIGEIDEIEREAARIVDDARAEAQKIIEQAHSGSALAPQRADPGSVAGNSDTILTQEEKIEGARAHLYRRRGVILPQE